MHRVVSSYKLVLEVVLVCSLIGLTHEKFYLAENMGNWEFKDSRIFPYFKVCLSLPVVTVGWDLSLIFIFHPSTKSFNFVFSNRPLSLPDDFAFGHMYVLVLVCLPFS